MKNLFSPQQSSKGDTMVNPYECYFTDFSNPIYRYLGQPFPLAEYFCEVSESEPEEEEKDAIPRYIPNHIQILNILQFI